MGPEQKILRVWKSQTDLSLSDCLSQLCAGVGSMAARALLYSPATCQFALLSGGKLTGSAGQPVDVEPIYEARIFCADFEVRWVRSKANKGSAVCLTEQQTGPEGWVAGQSLAADDCQDGQYLLWGEILAAETADCAPGWSVLGDARIGPLPIPLEQALPPAKRAVVRFREYFGAAATAPTKDHGNTIVLEERLLDLVWLKDKAVSKNGEVRR